MSGNKILIYGGTTEGRKLAEYLVERRVQVHVCVATEYGESLLPGKGSITVTHNRMNEEEMETFIRWYQPHFVVDATHPYAVEVSENLKRACEKCMVSYLRLVRESAAHWESRESAVQQGIQESSVNQVNQKSGRGIGEKRAEKCIQTQGNLAGCEEYYVSTVEEAARYLENTKGNILVTTGSKELEAFANLSDYRERIYARVLPLGSVIEKCETMGITGRHLICMQGPFSEEMNAAMLREYQIRYLVTKESGTVGGYPEKCRAAYREGVDLVVVGRPTQERGYTFEEIKKILKKELQIQSNCKVSIIGIGTGAKELFTIQAERACREAELLIGARRMLEASAEEGQAMYEAYKSEEIVSYVKAHPEYEKVAVVLSGDVGFYSGAKRTLELLEQETDGEKLWIQTEVLPGISSVAYFCAKLGISWEDAALVSLHGRNANLIAAVRSHRKTIVLTGNAEDICRIGEKLTEYGYGQLSVWTGTDLSYETEKIRREQAQELRHYRGADLAVLYIENPEGNEQMTSCGIPDDAFIRGDVPMTKEEVRSVSISKLRLRRDSVIYDIGAGTGSVAIEAALRADQGKVYAVEEKEEALHLIRENQRRLGASNLIAVSGKAPEVLEELPVPDRVFIGGSKGHLKEILSVVRQKNPSARVVINAITLETLEEALQYIHKFDAVDEEVVQISVSKTRNVGGYHMMRGQNPIYIISFTMPGIRFL